MIKRVIAIKALVVIFTAILFTGCEKPAEQPEEITFIYDLDEALKRAVEKEQPAVVEFFRPNGPWSRMMDDSTFSDELVISMSTDMVFTKINALVDTIEAEEHGVSFYPTFIIFNSSGEEIDRLVGFYPPAEFFNEIQLYLQGNETLQDYHTRLADEPERPDYNLVLGEKYKYRSDWEMALEYFGNVITLADMEEDQYEIKLAMLGIADVHCEQGKFEQAAAEYEEFISRYPDAEKAEEAYRKSPYCLAENTFRDI